MRALAIVVGAILGAPLGLVVALLVILLISGNNFFAAAFMSVYGAPIGALLGFIAGGISAPRVLNYIRANDQAGRIRAKRLVSVIGGVVATTAAVVGLLALMLRVDNTPPSDRELLSNFDRHEKTFNQLIEMVKADKELTRVDTDWTNPREPETIGVTAYRITAYRRMLADARVPRGFQTQGFLIEVDFFYWMIGSAISSDITKGYAYIEGPAFNVVDSLDGYKPKPRADDVIKVYRHIRGNWYLFYEYIPG